jgi:hypothetical protein
MPANGPRDVAGASNRGVAIGGPPDPPKRLGAVLMPPKRAKVPRTPSRGRGTVDSGSSHARAAARWIVPIRAPKPTLLSVARIKRRGAITARVRPLNKIFQKPLGSKQQRSRVSIGADIKEQARLFGALGGCPHRAIVLLYTLNLHNNSPGDG